MCIIAAKPAGVILAEDVIGECFSWNDDGAGFCYVDNGKLVVQKGFFNVRKLYKEIQLHASHEMIIHFRRKSHGEISIKNCHPFKFLADGYPHFTFALAHNGVLAWRSTATESDTACFVKDVMQPHLSGDPYFLDRPTGRLFLEKFIGDKNKFVIMRYDSKKNETKTYIINKSAGVEDLGCWFSNTTYVKSADVTVGTPAYADNWRRWGNDDYEIGNFTLQENGEWRKSYGMVKADNAFDKVMKRLGKDKIVAIGANYGNYHNAGMYGSDGWSEADDERIRLAAQRRLDLAMENAEREDEPAGPADSLADKDSHTLSHLSNQEKKKLRRIAADFLRASLGDKEVFAWNTGEQITYLREHCREEVPVLSQLAGPAIDDWILKAEDKGELADVLYGPIVEGEANKS